MPAVKILDLLLLVVVLVAIVVFGVRQSNDYSANVPTVTVKLNFDETTLNQIENHYGTLIRQRFADWQRLMTNADNLSETEKLQQVNDFFNRNLSFADDATLWRKKDYWATPAEFICRGAGDCEDFAIAKYFTLLEMGVSDSKLRITYVKALQLNQAHMVLTYFATPQSIPLVLDNLTMIISPANERDDLQPVYSFNGSGLWQAKEQGEGEIGESKSLNPWADLKARIVKSMTENDEVCFGG